MAEKNPKLTRYMRELVRARGGDYGWQTDLARRAGVTPTAISDLLNEGSGSGVGLQLLVGLARALGVSVDQVIALADQWDGTRPLPLPQPEVTLASDRYPNRAIAAEFARRSKVNARAVDDILARRLQAHEDITPMAWLELMLGRARELEYGVERVTSAEQRKGPGA